MNLQKQKLPVEWKLSYRLSVVLETIIFYLVTGGLLWASIYFDWWAWTTYILIGLMILGVPFFLWDFFLSPYFFQKNWWHTVDDQFITLHRGKLKESEIVIPMTKVQQVEIKQGPLLRLRGLKEITIHTMASSGVIPGLPAKEAEQLRDTIAHLAQIKEVGE